MRGCFWHRHAGCKKTTTPSTDVEFWQKKFMENIARDRRIEAELRKLGWHVIVIWECQLRNQEALLQLPNLIFRRQGNDIHN